MCAFDIPLQGLTGLYMVVSEYQKKISKHIWWRSRRHWYAMSASDGPNDRDGIDDFVVPDVAPDIHDQLAPLEQEMYGEWRAGLAAWAYEKGKYPEFGEGYSALVVKERLYRIDRFAEWVWGRDEYGFTTSFTAEQADRYWEEVLKPSDNQLSTSRKHANAVALIFKKSGEGWEIPNSEAVYHKINEEDGTGFTDWLSISEMEAVKHASLRAYAVPRREEMAADEVEEWSALLAQRLRKPKHELDDEDWERANSYKIPSLVYVSCDVGFRPCEVERAPVRWFTDTLDDGYMSVPKDESSKNSDNWRCYLSDESVRLLKRWLEERDSLDKYDDTESVWMTREANPYSAESLRRPIMHNLMDEAGIDRSTRESGWYMIRRGVGTDIGTKRGIDAVMQQLRITNVETAKRYIRHDERGMRDYFDER